MTGPALYLPAWLIALFVGGPILLSSLGGIAFIAWMQNRGAVTWGDLGRALRCEFRDHDRDWRVARVDARGVTFFVVCRRCKLVREDAEPRGKTPPWRLPTEEERLWMTHLVDDQPAWRISTRGRQF